MAALIVTETTWLTKQKILHGPYRKSLLTPDLDHWFSAMTAHWEHWERCLSSHGQVLAPEILASWIWSASCAGHFNVQPSFRTAVLAETFNSNLRIRITVGARDPP